MKGKKEFTPAEADEIVRLLEIKVNSDRSRQKSIRNEIRSIGFYASDWGLSGSTASDFIDLVKSHNIKVTGTWKYSPSSPKAQSADMSRPKTTVQSVTSGSITTTNLTVAGEAVTQLKDNLRNIHFKTIEDLKKAGFDGFVPVAKLNQPGGTSVIPERPGVYMVVRTSNTDPKYLAPGVGIHYKVYDPEEPILELKKHWVENTCVVYIGKAGSKAGGKVRKATIRSRLRQYLKTGLNKAKNHSGGRFIWRLEDRDELLFCWLPLPPALEPKKVEEELIAMFKNQYGGCRPFANLID